MKRLLGLLLVMGMVGCGGPPAGTALQWNVADEEPPPKSESGSPTTIVFYNNTKRKVQIYWVNYEGGLQLYWDLNPGESYKQPTFSSHTWLITDVNDKPLGYFRATRNVAKASIPVK